MVNTLQSKTLTATLPGNPRTTFAWIANPDNLPQWYKALGPVHVRFVRDDRAHILDLVMELSVNVELIAAIRVLPNGDGTEIVLTLVQPRELPDPDFQEHIRWAEEALQALKRPWPEEPEVAAAKVAESTTPAFVPTTGKKLFVGNLPFDWTDEPLRALFAATGNVTSAVVARFRGRGRSRGFGFVEMATEEEAKTAIEKLNGTLAGSRTIIVHLARSQEHRPPAGRTPAPSASQPRHAVRPPQRPQGPRRHDRPPRRPGRPQPPRREAPQRDDGIVDNKGGYEIFPLRGRGGPLPRASNRPSAPRSNAEASPYFDDTGDIENRGQRGPRRRRR
jgi:RNA recognition motif-containing protein